MSPLSPNPLIPPSPKPKSLNPPTQSTLLSSILSNYVDLVTIVSSTSLSIGLIALWTTDNGLWTTDYGQLIITSEDVEPLFDLVHHHEVPVYGPGVGGPALPAAPSGGDPVVGRVTAAVVTAQHVHVGTQALQGPVSRQHSLLVSDNQITEIWV